MVSGTFYALLAGFGGAAASLCAKLTLGTDYLNDMCQSGLTCWSTDGSAMCDWVSLTHHINRTVGLFRCNTMYKSVKPSSSESPWRCCDRRNMVHLPGVCEDLTRNVCNVYTVTIIWPTEIERVNKFPRVLQIENTRFFRWSLAENFDIIDLMNILPGGQVRECSHVTSTNHVSLS